MKTVEKQQLISSVKPILNKYGVTKAAVFGSVARGEDNTSSDIDILVELPEGSTLFDLAGLRIDLCEELSRDIDVITYNSLNPHRKENILKDQIPIL
ncbi:MAG: nucleotidyltransferase family protein [Candidatus Saccharimonadales bacterium]